MALQQRWLVKDAKGRIYGPFTNEKILKLIGRSVFVGDERIAEYPDGDFLPISKVAVFYDRLLDVLSVEAGQIPEAERHKELTKAAETPAETQEEPQTKTRKLPVNRAVREDPRKNQIKPQIPQKEPAGIEPPRTDENVIELQSQEDEPSGNKRNFLIGLSLLVLALVVLAQFFQPDQNAQNNALPKGFVALQAPAVKRQPLPEPEAKARLAKAAQLFQSDTFEFAYRAQEILVELLESGFQGVDAYSLLCLVHRELWPFSNQDSKDLLAVSKVAQQASTRDPVGVSGATCRVVQQLLGGQFDGAASLTDSILNENPQAATFYEFKSQILTSKGDHTNALAYLEKGSVLLPDWLKLKVLQAEALTKLDRFTEAAALLREVTKRNPSHAIAHTLLSEIELYQFKQLRSAVELAVSARTMGRMPKGVEARGWVVSAVGFETGQKIPEALESAKRAFLLDPTNLSAKEIIKRLGGSDMTQDLASADRELVALGEEYLRKGNFFAAQAELKSAFELNPKNGRAAMLAARSLWELNQSLDAIEWMKKAISADPSLIQAHIDLADYYAQRYDFASAYQTLQAIQKKDPQNYQVLAGFARVELRRFNFKGAAEMAKRALKIYDTDVETLVLLAKAQKGLSDFTGAFETLARVITLDANFKEGQALYGEVLGVQQGADLAVKYLQDLINTYPQEIMYRLSLGNVLLRDERLLDAIEQLKQATALNERSKEAFVLLGKAYQRRAEPRAALKAYLSAAALDPSDAFPVFLAGELYLQQSNFSQAKQQFEQVLRVNRLFPKANYMLGKTSLLMGEFDRAFQLATLEKRQNPALADGYELAGEVLMARRDFTKAATEFQRASQIAPTVTNILSLARAYRLADNPSVAQSLINRAIKIEDGNPEIYKEQGAIFEAQGGRAEAVVAYRKYLDLAPNAADRTVIENRIKGLGGQ